MSYDIRFGVKVAGAADDIYAVIGEPERSNPTYNNGPIFRKCMDWDYKQGEWYPMIEVMPKVERGIRELKFYPNKYKALEPDNGWGGVKSSLEALESIYGWFNSWDMGWNEEIPLECIYMCW